MKKKFKREPSNLEFMEITHKRKDGSYVQNTKTQELMDTATCLVADRMMRFPEKSKESIENAVFDELMYDDEVHNQRVVGYGFGVSRSHVFGVKAQLKNLAFTTHDSTLIEEFAAMKKENAELKETCTNLVSFFNRVTTTLARLGVNLDDEETPFMATNDQQAEMMKSRLEREERERQQIKEKARLQAEAEVVEDAQRKATALETKHRREHEKATTRKTFGADDTMRHKSSVVRSLFMPEKDKKGSTYEFKEQQQNKASSSNHKSTMKKEFRRLSKAAENQDPNKRLI